MVDKIITIIVPSYNMEKYLPKCLGSLVVAPELMEKLEVLVVNDGSKDRTSEIAHAFNDKYPQTFKVVDKPNGNYGSCINAALPLAKGKYVKVLDADDTFSTIGFERLLRFLSKTDVDVVLTDYDVVNEVGEVIQHQKYALPIGQPFSVDELTEERCGLLAMHAVAYKLCNIINIGYRQSEGISYTDLEWMFIPMSAMRSASYLPVCIYKYLLGRNGQTCDDAVFVKGIPTNARISLKMLADYIERRNNFSKESYNYMHTRLLSRLRRIYAYYLFDYVGKRPIDELVEYDRQIKEKDESLYSEVGEVRVSRRLRFAYIQEWRNRKFITPVKFLLFRIYSKLASSMFVSM